jgi:hypothetical protein
VCKKVLNNGYDEQNTKENIRVNLKECKKG